MPINLKGSGSKKTTNLSHQIKKQHSLLFKLNWKCSNSKLYRQQLCIFSSFVGQQYIKLANPLCSLSCVSFERSFIFIKGFLIENAVSINSLPSDVKPAFCRIVSAILLTASKTL